MFHVNGYGMSGKLCLLFASLAFSTLSFSAYFTPILFPGMRLLSRI
jgi:hypothetical protein